MFVEHFVRYNIRFEASVLLICTARGVLKMSTLRFKRKNKFRNVGPSDATGLSWWCWKNAVAIQ